MARTAARRRAEAPAREPRPAVATGIPPALWIAVAVLVVARLVFAGLIPLASEDAYITFRVARNLVEGHGLAYNPGERVWSVTSVPWTLWVAAGLFLHVDPVVWTRASAIALDLVTVLCAGSLLAGAVSRRAAIAFAGFFAAWPFFSFLADSGMEMNLMLALIALTAWLAARRSAWAGIPLGLLALVRPEGLAAAVVTAVWAGGRARLAALAIAAAGYGALALHFGSVVPFSMIAKTRSYGLAGPWQARGWWEWAVPLDLGRIPAFAEPVQLWPLRVVLLPAAVAGAWVLRRTPALAFAAACVAIWAGYAVAGAPYFFWYFAAPAAGFAFLAAAGLERLTRGPWIAAALGLFVLGTWTYYPFTIYGGRAAHEAQLFGGAAAELAAHARPGDTVFLEPIGHVGWANPQVRVVDEVGLVNPGVAARRARGAGWYAAIVDRERPRWLIVRRSFLESRESLAGPAPAFRDEAEAARVLLAYVPVTPQSANPRAEEMILLERRAASARP